MHDSIRSALERMNVINDAKLLQRFREEVSFYVNGTLDKETTLFIEECLTKYPELQAEVDFANAIRRSVKSVGENRREDEGLDRLLQFFEAHQEKSFRKKWQRFLDRCTDWGLSPAFAVVTCVAIIQGVFLWQSYQAKYTFSSVSEYRSIRENQYSADIKMTISPNLTFGDLVILLREHGANIIFGPSDTGEIWISVENHDQIDALIEELRSSKAVMDVIKVETAK